MSPQQAFAQWLKSQFPVLEECGIETHDSRLYISCQGATLALLEEMIVAIARAVAALDITRLILCCRESVQYDVSVSAILDFEQWHRS